MEPFNPIVINSRAASEHFGQMKNDYSSIIEGIAHQAQRVQQFNQNREQERLQKETMDRENNQRTMDSQTRFQNEQMANNLKQKELDIKAAALNQ